MVSKFELNAPSKMWLKGSYDDEALLRRAILAWFNDLIKLGLANPEYQIGEYDPVTKSISVNYHPIAKV